MSDQQPRTTSFPIVGASMTLITEVMERPLDPSYAAAARNRGKHYRHSLSERIGLLLLAVAIGVLTTTAVVTLRAPEPSTVQARELLVSEIASTRSSVDTAMETNHMLRLEVDALHNSALRQYDPGLLRSTQIDALVSGGVAATGPGVVLTMSDGVSSAGNSNARVQDSDIQNVVNELWTAGAEGIALNGHRLGSTSAIRSAGDAILVDLVGIQSPYVIDAIGSGISMQQTFESSAAWRELQRLSADYGISSSLVPATSLKLEAAPARTGKLAEVEPRGETADSAPSNVSTTTVKKIPSDVGSATEVDK